MQQKKRHMMPEILHVTKIGTAIYLSMKINLKLTENYDKKKCTDLLTQVLITQEHARPQIKLNFKHLNKLTFAGIRRRIHTPV